MCISIIGESGVGKRTLGDALYRNFPNWEEGQPIQTKLQTLMEPDAWPEEVVHILYNALSKEMENSGEGTDLACKLRGYFSDKKYKLIFGGITSIAMFNLLRSCLPDDSSNYSTLVLLLDAEHEEVALRANWMNKRSGINGIYQVSRLDKKTSGELFCCKSLRKGEVLAADGDIEEKYEEMVFGITGGHRLSIVLLAGLLRFKERPLQWEAVLQHLLMQQDEQQQDAAKVDSGEQQQRRNLLSCCTSLERIFWASFEDLPNDVKSCFLSFAIEMKNAAVGARGLVSQWIAEGFIRPHKGKTMEEVGKRYLKELVLRGLVQVFSLDTLGEMGEVRVHSSLHCFLQSEAREAGFAEVHDYHDVSFVPPSARRLSFHIHGGRYAALTSKLPKLRSFQCVGKDEADKGIVDSTGATMEAYDISFLLASKFLRVLILEGQRVTELKELPSSINRLLKLQVLDISGSGVQTVDPGFWKIKTLRHVYASNLTLPETLEHDMGELQTLVGVQPPQGQTWDQHKCPLRGMTKLHKLWLVGFQHEYHRSALENALQNMHLLISVILVAVCCKHWFTAYELPNHVDTWDKRDDKVGFVDDVKRLEEILLRKDHPETMCISIIGESGVGKRTLGDALYRNFPNWEEGQPIQTKLQTLMEPDAWPEEVVHILYNALSKEMENSGEGTDLACKLRGYFSDKKYKLIFGGITSIAMFNLLRSCLPDDSSNYSTLVLLLDAEHEEVALRANWMNKRSGINGIYQVSRLDKKTSGELFCCKSLRKGEVLAADGDIEEKYEEMVFGITGGHRLSIVLLAGLLRFKERPLQWEAVLQHLLMQQDEQQQDAAKVDSGEQQQRRNLLSCCTSLERIFWASFEDLPNDVKSCFLSFAIEMKNAAVGARGLVSQWIAEGFIRPHKGKTMEEVGKRYLKELVLRGLVQVFSLDTLGEMGEVRVHSSLHCFLQSEAREAGFAEVHDYHDVSFVPPSARRLSFHIHGGRYAALTSKLPKLRSFQCVGKDEADKGIVDSTGATMEAYDISFLLASKFLRVLILEGQRVTELKELPSSINRLLKLQVLDISGSGVQTVDPGFWKIKTLRHVYASNLTLPETLEHDMGELQTLVGVQPPQGQTWDQHKCPLRGMTKLHKLWLVGFQHEYHRSALENALQNMHLLISVILVGDFLPSCVFTAENLRFLQEIELEGQVDWPIGGLNHRRLRPNLVRIAVIPTIQQIPPHIRVEL
ncbi:hypothetical protein ACQ4PT_017755 [Festuca glaucescens]